jgi:hypothetical protein
MNFKLSLMLVVLTQTSLSFAKSTYHEDLFNCAGMLSASLAHINISNYSGTERFISTNKSTNEKYVFTKNNSYFCKSGKENQQFDFKIMAEFKNEYPDLEAVNGILKSKTEWESNYRTPDAQFEENPSKYKTLGQFLTDRYGTSDFLSCEVRKGPDIEKYLLEHISKRIEDIDSKAIAEQGKMEADLDKSYIESANSRGEQFAVVINQKYQTRIVEEALNKCLEIPALKKKITPAIQKEIDRKLAESLKLEIEAKCATAANDKDKKTCIKARQDSYAASKKTSKPATVAPAASGSGAGTR